eukprot:5010025-Karenia_brevis.AAC.1
MLSDIPETLDTNLGDLAMRKQRKSKSSKAKDVDEGGSPGSGVQITWLRNPFPVPLKPDGRACSICSRHDSADDPVSLALGVKEPMWWGRTPNPNGSTHGDCCGYCVRYHKSTEGKKGVKFIDYKKKLGSGSKALDEHCVK